ncbi:MAG: hypothetical protein ABI847_14585 [Anaerolineales bacterium]
MWAKAGSSPGAFLRALALGLTLGGLAACAGPTALPPLPTAVRATETAESQVLVLGVTPTATGLPGLVVLPEVVPLGAQLSANGSYTQTETEAAGPMVCQIQRSSCAFSHLVSNQDPNLLFSGSEAPPYGAEDRLMHPAMLQPLAKLAELVKQEWGEGERLMITEAYDSLLEHDLTQPNLSLRYSLHFEGRSVDLITIPPNVDNDPRLCSLAIQAGFAWVHNEGDHCHASIQAVSLCSVCSARAP